MTTVTPESTATTAPVSSSSAKNDSPVDAIVVGTGLGGLVTALQLLDRGASVILVEKCASMGGNTLKASSGLNAVNVPRRKEDSDEDSAEKKEDSGTTQEQKDNNNNDQDTTAAAELQSFIDDTIQSAGSRANRDLIQLLAEQSAAGVAWLQDRVQLDLQTHEPAQLGGHQRPRTRRPVKGAIGFALVSALKKALEPFVAQNETDEESNETKEPPQPPRLQILLETQVTELLTTETEKSGTTVTGVKATKTNTPKKNEKEESKEPSPPTIEHLVLPARHVVLATGGFAASHHQHQKQQQDKPLSSSNTKSKSLLAQHAPHDYYLQLPSTVGPFSTGDGHTMAITQLQAQHVDMDQIQIHPTGFVDPTDPDNPSKILCAELLRGMGGILLNAQGRRFCNELGPRDYVAGRMLEEKEQHESSVMPPFYILIPAAVAQREAGDHVGFYTWKKLLQKCRGPAQVAKAIFPSDDGHTNAASMLEETLASYARAASAHADEFGKTVFPNAQEFVVAANDDGNKKEQQDETEFLIGQVTPVIHYCMGGLAINSQGQVLMQPTKDNNNAEDDDENNNGSNRNVIPGLYAVGEVAGGVHGANRLAGNSLLECLVFGSIVGKGIPLA